MPWDTTHFASLGTGVYAPVNTWSAVPVHTRDITALGTCSANFSLFLPTLIIVYAKLYSGWPRVNVDQSLWILTGAAAATVGEFFWLAKICTRNLIFIM